MKTYAATAIQGTGTRGSQWTIARLAARLAAAALVALLGAFAATRIAGAQAPDDSDDLDSVFAIRLGGGFDFSRLQIWTDSSAYRIGDGIRFCYTVPAPGEIAIYDYQPNGAVTTLITGFDDGRGDCLVGTVTPPSGRECLRIRFFYRGGSVSRATCFDVYGGTVTGFPPTGGTTQSGGNQGARTIDWGYNPREHRDEIGRRFVYFCPANGSFGSVWGTDVYTDDSSLCTAAVHAGLISASRGGTVAIEMLGRQESFRGSSRNGVSTSNYGGWPGSFRFVR